MPHSSDRIIFLGIFILLVMAGTAVLIVHDYNSKLDYLALSVNNELGRLSAGLVRENQELRQELSQLSRVTGAVVSSVQELGKNIEELDETTASNLRDLSNKIATVESTSSKQISMLKSSLDGDFSDILEDILPSVVSVKTNLGQGSGFYVDDSTIITNYHVIEDAAWIQVVFDDASVERVSVRGADVVYDLALLTVVESRPALSFADEKDIVVGAKVVAVGNPLGLSFSVTQGIISGLDRRVSGSPIHFIQTDTPINPGNSGGPLIDSKGNVVGITTAIYDGSNSIGFAISAGDAEQVIDSIEHHIAKESPT